MSSNINSDGDVDMFHESPIEPEKTNPAVEADDQERRPDSVAENQAAPDGIMAVCNALIAELAKSAVDGACGATSAGEIEAGEGHSVTVEPAYSPTSPLSQVGLDEWDTNSGE